MRKKILFIERKFWGFVSIEKVFEAVARALDPERFASEFRKVRHGNDFAGVFRNLLEFRAPRADLYHVTGHVHYMALVLPPARTVLTVHDLGFLHLRRGLRGYVIRKLFLDWPIKRLRYVTAISATTKREIVAETNCPPDKIRVIENPLQEQYAAGGQAKPFDARRPVVLQIGTLPNKNVPNLVRALAGLECRLRIVGRVDDALAAALAESGVAYDSAVDLDDAAMKREYERADIVAFCSTYEGFGLPIIEAQAMGVPVVTSDREPMREVAKGGAHLADPDDPRSIRAGFVRIIEDAAYREKLVAAGRENVARFRPERIAGAYAELYDEVLSELIK